MTPSETIEQAKEKVRDTAGNHGGGSQTKKVLVPIAASIVGGVAAYGARKAPELVGERLVPKLKEATGEGGVLEKAKNAVEGVVPSSLSPPTSGSRREPAERAQRTMSHEQRERERRERAERRKARRKALAR
jgi:hypothetical protein